MRRIGLALAIASLTLPAQAQDVPATGADITVTGSLQRPSNWRAAETDHVELLSDGSEADLVRIARNIDKLHFVLAGMLGRADRPDDTVRLRFTLIGDPREFDAMNLRNHRSAQGPFAERFPADRYYDPREDGAVAAATRFDQPIVLQQGVSLQGLLPQPIDQATGLPSTDLGFANDLSLRAPVANERSAPWPAEQRIYAAYAQHFLLNQVPAAYPRWYVDGFGQVFGTITAPDAATLEIGRPPEALRRVLDHYRAYPVRRVFDGSYLSERPSRTHWTPVHAWLLTHTLMVSDARRAQLKQYLAAVAAGTPSLEAAAVFGDLALLDREVAEQARAPRITASRVTIPADRIVEPFVRRLSRGQAAFVHGRLELGSRVELAGAGEDGVRRRDRWLDRLRSDAARFPGNAEAQLLLAEAECRSAQFDRCRTAADAALVARPDDAAAVAWRGTALARLAGSEADRADARQLIVRANRAAPDTPLPLLRYFDSFVDAGQTPPVVALDGMLRALDSVPAAPATRLRLGRALVAQGYAARAREVLRPVAGGAFDTPERSEATALLARLPENGG